MSVTESTLKSPRPAVLRARILALAADQRASDQQIAKQLYGGNRRDSRIIDVFTKAAVDTLSTQSGQPGAELYSVRGIHNELAAAVRPLTVIGKLPGVQYAPMNEPLPYISTRSVATFVEERMPIPTVRVTFGSSVLLTPKKCASIIVTSKPLLKHTEAEDVLRTEIVSGCVEAVDKGLLDPAHTLTAARPASISSEAIEVFSGSGADTSAEIDTILSAMVGTLIGAGSNLVNAAWITGPVNCAELSQKRTTGSGDLAYAGVKVNGGVLYGLPLIASASCPSDQLILVDSSELIVADENEIFIEVSQEAMLEMDSAPDGNNTLVSLFSTDSVGLRITRVINWQLRRPYVTRCTGFALQPASATTA